MNSLGKSSRRTRLDFIQQCDIAIFSYISSVRDVSYHMQILDMRKFLVESCQFMEVGGKEAEGVNLRRDVP